MIEPMQCETRSAARAPLRAIGERDRLSAPRPRRMFCIDARHQGRGLATQASRALGPYLAKQYPEAATVYLTVNHRNPGAKAAYLKGGFTDTGEDYLGGPSGPQYIMRLPLRTAAPAA